jgi:hypothetical protein
VLVDRTGRVELLSIPPGPYTQPRLSPAGKRFAVVTLVPCQGPWEGFDSDLAIQARIARRIDLAHPASAQSRGNLTRSELEARG